MSLDYVKFTGGFEEFMSAEAKQYLEERYGYKNLLVKPITK